jgi:mannose-6-phosphate isomerase-like protein (cupin superfamily)
MTLLQGVFVSAIVLSVCCAWSAPSQPQQQPAADTGGHHLVACPDSPNPGKRPAGSDCAFVARQTFATLPKEPIVLRVETFPTTGAAEDAATPASAVVQAAGKIWLLTLATQGERSQSGTFITEIGPISGIPSAPRYEMQVADADFGPAANAAISKAVHTHSGPEIWYLITGEQCLETPDGAHRAKAGEGMFAPTGVPMQLNITGSSNREALFAIVHDASKPATTVSEWQPKGLCQK